MSWPAHIEHRPGEFTDTELRCVAATLVQTEPENVCEIAMVIVIHGADGSHEIRMAADNTAGPVHLAGLLGHAAAHLRGNCRECNRRNRKAGRRV